jgi:hypothetical protein
VISPGNGICVAEVGSEVEFGVLLANSAEMVVKAPIASSIVYVIVLGYMVQALPNYALWIL